MTGPLLPALEGMKDLRGREIAALMPIAVITLVLGLFPAPILNVINPAVDTLMTTIGVTDPPTTLNPSTTVEGTQE
jgi:NADH-quinone oxidoreductase subunit M